ncbi:MAG: LysM peptidoglycan-binding domain-containing M23 family metallopeptidase [Anaerolineales bacterium]|nr:LysM peptidoglycan-binding domain-containing M23 family metallopeptidase [Anaerolineales bacterium]
MNTETAPEPTRVATLAGPAVFPTPDPLQPILTPTPDAVHALPGIRTEEEQYVVQPGDILNKIARRYQVSLQLLISANQLQNPDYLEVGQLLVIPAPDPGPTGPADKVIPDSELVYGPASVGFDVENFTSRYDSYLLRYEQEVEGRILNGPQIIERVARDYSINPRLLLAVLEYQAGWVTKANPHAESRELPIQKFESWRKGLYFQLTWTASSLNRGFYLWQAGGLGYFTLPNGEVVPVDPTINAGTAAVQYLFSLIYERADWERAVTAQGLQAVYQGFFGYPFHWSVEPLLPEGLGQPTLQLPFEEGQGWAFTGGPHAGWGDGSAWAGLDFAPPGSGLGCVSSDAWVVAVADGTIVRSDQGAVIQDLDVNGSNTNDGQEQTGWVVLYMHIESRERIPAGSYVRAGERIGHPSCEGGVSTGTHLHIARRYNGVWISADGSLPFVLEGWVSRGAGQEYDGYLQKNGNTIEAWEGIRPENTIYR